MLCVDEKSQIQALDRTAPILPMLPGVPERATHDYKRSGTSSLYAALDLASGQVIGRLHSRHRAIEFRKFLQTIDAEVPERPRRSPRPRQRLHPQDAGDQTLAARPSPLRTALHPDQQFVAEPRRTVVLRTDHQKAAARHPPLVRQLNQDIRAWIDTWNENPKPFVWTKTSEQILDSIATYCQTRYESAH